MDPQDVGMYKQVERMPRRFKRLVMMLTDAASVPLALWAAFALRLGQFAPDLRPFWWLFVLLPALSLPVFAMLSFYRVVIRYMAPHAVLALIKGVTISTLVLAASTLMVSRLGFPRSVVPLYWLLLLLCVGGSRFIARAYLQWMSRQSADKRTVIVYGAGDAGARLVGMLASGRDYQPVALIDDNPALHGNVVGGVRVYSPARLGQLISEYGVSQVLLALPSISKSRRKEILQHLESYPVHVRTIPGLTDLLAGRAQLDHLREVDVEDLLGRDPIAPDQELLERCVRGKSVLVTGAGGSIGSELCRQIVRLQPRRLVLLELSEYALYRIERELRPMLTPGTELIPLLGTVLNRRRLREIMCRLDVQTVYHAAAYKHVPIVEQNILEGMYNNVIGTLHAGQAAQDAEVETFVLISTDKAVRPTNVMGASKRLAELALQGLAQQPNTKTRFCLVRFGNVLGSSGSVVPLFREQITRGGPVTVTHPEITRYFMTIPEAAALVIQAGAMAQGGDVFVLDMGEPVKIVDLARKMIHLTGYTVRDEKNPDGEIEIHYTGLRPGEKLYEELLIGDNVTGTQHPMIMRAMETSLPWKDLECLIDRLMLAFKRLDCAEAHAVLMDAVSGFVSNGPHQDLLWQKAPRTGHAARAEDNVAYLRLPPI